MRKLSVTIEGQTYQIEVAALRPGQTETVVKVNGEELRVVLPDLERRQGEVEFVVVDDRPYRVQVDREYQWLQVHPAVYRLELQDLEQAPGPVNSRNGHGPIKAPIPGQVTRVLVSSGQTVSAGQPLLILEAMKMENEICAPHSGRVRTLHVAPGAKVKRGADLVEIT